MISILDWGGMCTHYTPLTSVLHVDGLAYFLFLSYAKLNYRKYRLSLRIIIVQSLDFFN